MSVLMTLRIKGDASALEAWADANQDTMTRIIEKSKTHGMIAHRFYADDSGNVMVIDEWPDAESFQAFFQESMPDIGPMMAAAGVQGEPDVSFWRELDTRDRHGWGA